MMINTQNLNALVIFFNQQNQIWTILFSTILQLGSYSLKDMILQVQPLFHSICQWRLQTVLVSYYVCHKKASQGYGLLTALLFSSPLGIPPDFNLFQNFHWKFALIYFPLRLTATVQTVQLSNISMSECIHCLLIDFGLFCFIGCHSAGHFEGL